MINKLTKADDIQHIAIMPDIHLAHDVCIGLVIATKNLIYPQAVGRDIGCGMMAIRFNNARDIFQQQTDVKNILKGLNKLVPIIKHQSQLAYLPNNLKLYALSHKKLEKYKVREAKYQFATLGRGNHFLEFQIDENQQIWLTIHSGSRIMGQAITDFHLTNSKTDSSGLSYLKADSPEGQAYLNDLNWAISYSRQSREYMIRSVSEFIKNLYGISVDEASLLDCCHNHVYLEEHFNKKFWVHRKGAIRTDPEQVAIIPGSMGTVSYHVCGRSIAKALNSASHGAGRLMTRTEARQKISSKDFCSKMQGVWFDQFKESKLIDEAPQAYKDINKVMRAQKQLVKIVRQLRPIFNFKG